jgi:UDP-GlcNAc:undecaprenyl-phosphate GlcNAc-1-phosphate transferase
MIGRHLICGLLGFGVSYGVILLILRARGGIKFKFLRTRDEFHHTGQASVSRLGGLGLAAAFISVVFLALTVLGHSSNHEIVGVVGAALAMFGLGLWDDLTALGAKRKLFGQLTIASAAYFLGIGISHFKIPLTSHIIDLGFWSWPITVFWIVAMTNLINLIDGVDGLAGGITLMLMLLLSVVGGSTGCVTLEAAGMVGALLAFLRFNFPPAKIYMGDGGAYFLGSLVGLLTIRSSQKGTVVAALIAPLFVLALPILDTSLAIVRRGLRGLPLFRADRGHIHHRLLEGGLSRRKLVLNVYAFTAFFLGLGFLAFWGRGQYLPLIFGSGILVVLLVAGRLSFIREWSSVGRMFGNSMNLRAEIQYTLAQTRWLALEGTRAHSIGELCDDTVFIARKLGFDTVLIRLEDGERTWAIELGDGNDLCLFRHKLPGHYDCFIEFGVSCPKMEAGTKSRRTLARQKFCGSCAKTKTISSNGNAADFVSKDCAIISELLAEGWAKSLAAWEKQNQLPLRFNPCLAPVPEKAPEKISAMQTATT